jgi:K+-sensing histidine kinase KdpD
LENLLVTIVTFKKLHVGCFVKEKFEFEGIECFLTDEGFKTTNSNIPQGIKLKVRANETEKAIRVILQIHKEYDLDKIEQDSSVKDMKKILVPIDFSEYSINVCKFAVGIAEKTNAEINFLYVYNEPYKQNKVDKLNQLLTKEYGEHKIVCKVFKSSNIIKGFDEFIEKNNIDIISFSKPKRSLFYKLFHPSNLEKLVSTEKIPMLIFPV